MTNFYSLSNNSDEKDQEYDFNPNKFNHLINDGELSYYYLSKELVMWGCPKDLIDNMIARIRFLSAIQVANIRTGAELVEKSSVNKGSISQYYNGVHIPSSNNAKKLGDVLGVNPLWLMAFDAPRYYSGYANSKDNEPLHEKIIEKFDKLEDSQKQLILKMLDIN